jgi:hypothetical protein
MQELLLFIIHVENVRPTPSQLVTRQRPGGDRMRKVIADEFVTLDGVVQAPSYADEDVAGGFGHGGWNNSYLDDQSTDWVLQNVRGAGGYLLGRGTYEIFARHWPDGLAGAWPAR